MWGVTMFRKSMCVGGVAMLRKSMCVGGGGGGNV